MLADPARNLVLALVAENENQALATYSEGMGMHYVQMGYDFRVINLYHPEGSKELLTLLKSGRVAFAYGFAGVGSQLAVNDVNLWTASQTPFAALWFDHPCYNYRQHMVDSPYVLQCYHVQDHFEARQKYLPASTSPAILLSMPFKPSPLAAEKPWAERKHKILFVKTANQPEVWAEGWKKHPAALQNVLWALVEQALKDRNLDLAGTTRTLLDLQGLDVMDLDLYMGVVQEVDAYIRGWRSDKMARALLNHPSVIIGRGWEYLQSEPGKATFLPPVSAPEFMRLALNHKIIANVDPLWRHGVHERVGTALSMGAVVFTDRSLKSENLFGQVPNYVGFEWQDDVNAAVFTAWERVDNTAIDKIMEGPRALVERYPPEGYEGYIKSLLKAVTALQSQ